MPHEILDKGQLADPSRQMTRLTVSRTWNGDAIDPRAFAMVEFFIDREELIVRVDAPFHGDVAPASPVGSTDRLWEYEVVELFLLGADSAYLEIELGPHGHYLVLQLQGERRVIQKGLPIAYSAEIDGGRWHGVARVPLSFLPQRVDRVNAYCISGRGERRLYLAAFPTGGDAPDFHRLAAFGKI